MMLMFAKLFLQGSFDVNVVGIIYQKDDKGKMSCKTLSVMTNADFNPFEFNVILNYISSENT